MLMKSKLREQIKVEPLFCDRFTAVVTAGATKSLIVDRLGYDSGQLCLIGGGASATLTAAVTVLLYDSDDSTSTGTWTTYDTANVSLSLYATAATTGDDVFVDLCGAKRYVCAEVTVGALAAASADVTVVLILGDSTTEPCV